MTDATQTYQDACTISVGEGGPLGLPPLRRGIGSARCQKWRPVGWIR
ncbi:MAG: hypothetical protein QOF01_5268 [Thermomicrobiales bacterium]|nr:hypothetical protein [Thermomicrobiales bacterium]